MLEKHLKQLELKLHQILLTLKQEANQDRDLTGIKRLFTPHRWIWQRSRKQITLIIKNYTLQPKLEVSKAQKLLNIP